MKKLILNLFLISSPFLGQVAYTNASSSKISNYSPYYQTERLNQILVENRVLARVNNNPISVIDVMKQMDADFYLEYPHLIDSVMSRYQFYKAQWRPRFERMVESELIYEEAKKKKVPASDGEIRQAIEDKYGSEVILTIDKLGLTYNEVWDMTKKEIMVQHMTFNHLFMKGYFNVSTNQKKVSPNISPKDLLAAYQNHLKNNHKPDNWKYYMISFKGPNAYEKAILAKEMLMKKKNKFKDFRSLEIQLQDKSDEFPSDVVSISDKLELSSDQIQQSHRDVLTNLEAHTLSDPVKEVSRITKKPVYRLFYLAQYTPGGKIKLAEVEEKLITQIRQEKFEDNYKAYVSELKERYGITHESVYDSIPSDFEPFKLK